MGALPAHGLQAQAHIPVHHQEGGFRLQAQPSPDLTQQASALPQLQQRQHPEPHTAAHREAMPQSAQPSMAGGLQPDGLGLQGRRHVPAPGSQGLSGASSRSAKTSLPQVSDCAISQLKA